MADTTTFISMLLSNEDQSRRESSQESEHAIVEDSDAAQSCLSLSEQNIDSDDKLSAVQGVELTHSSDKSECIGSKFPRIGQGIVPDDFSVNSDDEGSNQQRESEGFNSFHNAGSSHESSACSPPRHEASRASLKQKKNKSLASGSRLPGKNKKKKKLSLENVIHKLSQQQVMTDIPVNKDEPGVSSDEDRGVNGRRDSGGDPEEDDLVTNSNSNMLGNIALNGEMDEKYSAAGRIKYKSLLASENSRLSSNDGMNIEADSDNCNVSTSDQAEVNDATSDLLTCSKCNKVFTQTFYLEAHLKTHSLTTDNECSLCEKSFPNKSSLKRHLKCHTPDKPNVCQLCGKGFKQKSSLRKHLRMHQGIKPYSCSVCGRAFAESNNLKTHMRMHTGERPFKCSDCDKAFMDKSDLKKHIRVHTGARPFSCSVCNKSFRQKGYLKFHMRTHDGYKPFTCSICNKSFSTCPNLMRHIDIHTGEKPFQCLVCQKKFQKEYSLQRHLKSCGGEQETLKKRFICPVCRQLFCKLYSARRHLEKTHPQTGLPPTSIIDLRGKKGKRKLPTDISEQSSLSNDFHFFDPAAGDFEMSEESLENIKSEIISTDAYEQVVGQSSTSTSTAD